MLAEIPYYIYFISYGVVGILSVIVGIRYFLRRWFVVYRGDENLQGKTVVITGGNSGIGHATAVELAKRGAKVILACRDRSRRESAPFSIRSKSGNIDVKFMYLDLSSLDSVVEFARNFSEREPKLDILINNAAVICPKEWTADGIDQVMGINYFGHFLLTNLLLDRLTAVERPRVINMISDAWQNGSLELNTLDFCPPNESEANYSMYNAYGSSKLALLLMTKEMAHRFKHHKLTVVGVNPGTSRTKLLRYWSDKGDLKSKIFDALMHATAQTPEQGCQAVLYAALAPQLEKTGNGKLIKGNQLHDFVLHKEYGRFDYPAELWEKTESILKVKGFSLILDDNE